MKGIGIQVCQAMAAAGKAGQARQWYGQMDRQMGGQTGECYQGHIQPGRLCGGT